MSDKPVKPSNLEGPNKKLQLRGVRFFHHFGVLEYVVIIENATPEGSTLGVQRGR